MNMNLSILSDVTTIIILSSMVSTLIIFVTGLNRKIIVNRISKNLIKNSGWYNAKITYKKHEVNVSATCIEVNEYLPKYNRDDLHYLNSHHMTKYVFKINGNLVAMVSWIDPNNTYFTNNWKYSSNINEFYSIICKINRIRNKESRFDKKQQKKEFYEGLKRSDSFYEQHDIKGDTSDDQ